MQYVVCNTTASCGLPGQVSKNAPRFAQRWLVTDKEECLPDHVCTRGALTVKQGWFVEDKFPDSVPQLPEGSKVRGESWAGSTSGHRRCVTSSFGPWLELICPEIPRAWPRNHMGLCSSSSSAENHHREALIITVGHEPQVASSGGLHRARGRRIRETLEQDEQSAEATEAHLGDRLVKRSQICICKQYRQHRNQDAAASHQHDSPRLFSSVTLPLILNTGTHSVTKIGKSTPFCQISECCASFSN